MNTSPFDFEARFRDPHVFMLETSWRSLNSRVMTGGTVLSKLTSTSNEELRKVIVEDVLAVTMYELQSGHKVGFDMGALYSLLTRNDFGLTMRAYEKLPENLIVVEDRKPRINSERLKEAMEYCGVYYTLPQG